jgi:hypothetical protein
MCYVQCVGKIYVNMDLDSFVLFFLFSFFVFVLRVRSHVQLQGDRLGYERREGYLRF